MEMYSVMRENPYRLAEDVSGVGFRIADEIAGKIGIHTDSDYASAVAFCIPAAGGGRRSLLSAVGSSAAQSFRTIGGIRGKYPSSGG